MGGPGTGGDPCSGLTLSVRARDELADSIGTNAITIAKLLDNVSERHRAQTDDLRREYRCPLAAARTPAERDRIRRAISESDAREQAGLIHPGQLVIVDEAGMVGTRNWTPSPNCANGRSQARADRRPHAARRARRPGGLLAWAEREHRCATLTSLWRFRSDPGSGRTTPTADGARMGRRGRRHAAPARRRQTARNRTASRHAAGSSPNTRPTTVSTGARTGNARRRRTG